MSAPPGNQARHAFWPTDTYVPEEKDIFFNHEPVMIYHDAAAHTDGDSIVFFRRSDVIVSGESATLSEIGQIVRAKFAEERAEMHRVIRANVKEGELPESMRGSAQRQQAEDDPPVNSNDRYARSAPAVRETESAPVPPTVLVFRDQHQQEVRNYAIVGQTLWNFASQRTQKIPLSDLDLVATTKANDERGLTFRVPASGEAQ
jgi:hypothetical protein